MKTNIKGIIEDLNKLYDKYINEVEVSLSKYINDVNYYNLAINPNHSNRSEDDVNIIRISRYKDLEKLISGIGFYIILTDYRYSDNKCKLSIRPEGINVKAVYRGHSYTLRERVESHIFNTKYNEKRAEKKRNNKYTTNFDICMKLEEGKQGVDIDETKYKSNVFYIIQHKMNNSNETQRKIMEKVFDKKYDKPIACMD